jgi:hypothetical protein
VLRVVERRRCRYWRLAAAWAACVCTIWWRGTTPHEPAPTPRRFWSRRSRRHRCRRGTGIVVESERGVQTAFAVARSDGSVVTFDLLSADGAAALDSGGAARRVAAVAAECSSSHRHVCVGRRRRRGESDHGQHAHHASIDFDLSHAWAVDVSPFFVRNPIAVALQSGSVGVACADSNRRKRGVPRAVIAGVDFAAANGDAPLNVDELRLWRGQSKKVLSTPEERRLHFLHSRAQAGDGGGVVAVHVVERLAARRRRIGRFGASHVHHRGKLEESAPAAAVRAKKAVSARKAKAERKQRKTTHEINFSLQHFNSVKLAQFFDEARDSGLVELDEPLDIADFGVANREQPRNTGRCRQHRRQKWADRHERRE